MSLRRTAAKRDLNEEAIVQALRKAGASVERLSGTPGLPDLLVGYRGANSLLEVKRPRGKYTPDQKRWAEGWRGAAVYMARSVDEALEFIGATSGGE